MSDPWPLSENLSSYELDWFDRISGGALGRWSLADSREALSSLAAVLFERLEGLEKQFGRLECETESGSDVNEAARNLMLDQAATSQAVVGLLAPLAETLIHRSGDAFRRLSPSLKPSATTDNSRADLSDDQFWDVSLVYHQDDKSVTTDLLGGFRQLLTVIGRKQAVAPATWELLEAFFQYRNRALHRGIAWDGGALQKFDRTITERKWECWFDTFTIQSGNDGPAPYIIILKKRLMDDFLRLVDELADRLWNESRKSVT